MGSSRGDGAAKGGDARARVADALAALERVARELLLAEQHVAPEAKLDAVDLLCAWAPGGESGATLRAATLRAAARVPDPRASRRLARLRRPTNCCALTATRRLAKGCLVLGLSLGGPCGLRECRRPCGASSRRLPPVSC